MLNAEALRNLFLKEARIATRLRRARASAWVVRPSNVHSARSSCMCWAAIR